MTRLISKVAEIDTRRDLVSLEARKPPFWGFSIRSDTNRPVHLRLEIVNKERKINILIGTTKALIGLYKCTDWSVI